MSFNLPLKKAHGTTKQEMKNALGHAAYVLEGTKRLTSVKAYQMEIEYDEKLMDETTAAYKVDEYFSSLLDFMNTHEDIFKKDEK